MFQFTLAFTPEREGFSAQAGKMVVGSVSKMLLASMLIFPFGSSHRRFGGSYKFR